MGVGSNGSRRGFLVTGGAVGDGDGAVTCRRTMVAGVGDGSVGVAGGGHCVVGMMGAEGAGLGFLHLAFSRLVGNITGFSFSVNITGFSFTVGSLNVSSTFTCSKPSPIRQTGFPEKWYALSAVTRMAGSSRRSV